jgi:membrane peptidoglycan carboxypeptidase
MAIAHILGRLAHFNSARDKSGEGWRVSGGQRDSQRPRTSIGRVLGRALLRGIGILRWTVLLAVLALIGWGVNYEMKTSYLEAWIFTRIDRDMSFAPQPGPSDSLRFPTHGPYDERLGYVAVPQFVSALSQRHFTVERQARWSKGLARFVDLGAFPIYAEKDRAGLRVFDRSGDEVYGTRFPLNAFGDFASIPPLVINSLLFIEDRYLFDNVYPEHNAAVEWNRFALAVVGRLVRLVVPGFNEGGASTLATQIEKFRHSPNGLTGGAGEKLRQMLTASAHVYINGPNTMKRREEIVTTYLNSTPLSSFPGYGEVIGLPDALYVWFGTDFNQAMKVLNSTPKKKEEWGRKGEIYRQVLALLLSGRLPSHYLITDRDGLGELTDGYVSALYAAGIIDHNLRDATRNARLRFRNDPPPFTQVSWVKQKATEEVRAKLMTMLGLPSLYSLDRLDLNAETTIDTAAQARVTAVLQKLSDQKFAQQMGMVGHQLLPGGKIVDKMTYSFVLYERRADGNYLRIHADSLNKPFDINSGAKLQLGSTAKLRTLTTYLHIMETLHQRFVGLTQRELKRIADSAPDVLTQWAATYMAKASDRSLQAMLDASVSRTYSGAPESFFTGGGVQGFGNFDSDENGGSYTVIDAFKHSVNLCYVRILRDIANHYTVESGIDAKRLLDEEDTPERDAYLRRFADADGKRFMWPYYKDFRSLNPNEAVDLLIRRTRPLPRRVAAIYLSVQPDARFDEFREFLGTHLRGASLTQDQLWDLYTSLSPEKMSLADRGYVAGVHPLELWVVSYLKDHPGASWTEVIDASADARQATYAWLFDGSLDKQDTRIKILIEQDAFQRIWENWREYGYPFGHLVPSLGTAIGASGDRPDALAELMGIILNDGVRQPSISIQRLRFAEGTPYETVMKRAAEPDRVMSHEMVEVLRRALMGVVQEGTARRLVGAYKSPDGGDLPVGGKTGTGDNRYHQFAAGGGSIGSHVVDRTGTFVFFLGDRFFGTVTAYVPGPDAARFSFTSGLAVQLLKVLEPELRPLINSSPIENAKPVIAAEPS